MADAVALDHADASKKKKLAVLDLLRLQLCGICGRPKKRFNPFCDECFTTPPIAGSPQLAATLEAKAAHAEALHALIDFVKERIDNPCEQTAEGVDILFGKTCGACADKKSIIHSMCKPCYEVARGSSEFEHVEEVCDTFFEHLENLLTTFTEEPQAVQATA